MLKSCVHCGSNRAVLHEDPDPHYRFVICDGCGLCAANADCLPEKDCVEVWNTRTDPVKEALAEALLELQRCGQKQGFNSSYESTMKRVAAALRRYEEAKHG